jgi:predicted DNA-binding transcriptional regulator AlpA
MARLLRYPDLKARGIVNNRMTLRRWIAEQSFPPGVQLGPNTVAWPENEVESWLASRERGRVPEVYPSPRASASC